MKKLFLVISFLLISSVWNLTSISSVHAVSTPPFAPFSVEGNPPEDYLFDQIFPLFRYVSAPFLEIFENLDRSRKYEDYRVCPGADSDRRDYYCDSGKSAESGCDGGEVDICHDSATNQSFAYITTSGNGSCKLPPIDPLYPDAIREGTCVYRQNPRISSPIKGTDFSIIDSPVYAKIQSESGAYNNVGTDNVLTWGSQQLSLTYGQKAINQLMVLMRAIETKNTLAQTGEWPLGWVDWGYKDKHMTKTLLEIAQNLPSGMSSAGKAIVEADDDFYLTAGDLDIISDVSKQKDFVSRTVAAASSQRPKPQWLIDFETVPLYSPSFRQGYTRPSICIWDNCCPGLTCPLPTELLSGTRRGLYYDLSISQTYGAAMADLTQKYSLKTGVKLFKNIVAINPLARFLISASPAATPSQIQSYLDSTLKGTCYDHVPWDGWASFGVHIDYLDSTAFLDPGKKCPEYQLMPEAVKHTAAARAPSLIEVILSLIWGDKVDDVEPRKDHLITIPDAMGQVVGKLQGPVYSTRDTLKELDKIKEYNEKMSNIVDDGGAHLYGGKRSGPNNALRGLGLYACGDNMFASQTQTTIEEYVYGNRPGCFDDDAVPEGKCDGQLMAKLLEGDNYGDTGPKGQAYFDANIKTRLTAELMNTYAAAEKATGVPCEILAGIHWVESGNDPEGSLVSGRKLGTPEPDAGGKVFKTLLETAIYAGEHLKGKVGGSMGGSQTAITALSRYNGGGNSNCQLGYPHPIPYGGCPRLFEGEDDPYPVSFLDAKHDNMYLLYCADRLACAPQIFERPGSFTVALSVYNSITKNGYSNPTLPPPPPPSPPPTTRPDPSAQTGFFPKSCAPQSLSTALGCIPYTRDAFTSALLGFIVSLAGAAALVIMLIATIIIMTAGGNPEQLKKGRELFTSAVVGLLFLIFSVSILRIIAGDIINLPGF